MRLPRTLWALSMARTCILEHFALPLNHPNIWMVMTILKPKDKPLLLRMAEKKRE